MELVQRLNYAVVKLQLSAEVREEIYGLLGFMLDNGEQMEAALNELHAIYSRDGKRPNAAPAVFIYEALAKIKEGRPFSEAIERYVTPEEASMIASGERSGRLRESFTNAIENLQKKKEVRKAVRNGVGYPLALFALLIVMMLVVSLKLMPALSKTIDLTMLTGPAAWLHAISTFVTNQGPYVGVVMVILIGVTAWSFPNVTGNIRYRLDTLPPWSVYRAMQGTTFLLNVGVMLKSGIQMQRILNMLAHNATPYMRERIEACIQGTNAGLNLGDALDKSELGFPDPIAVRLIRVFAKREGFDRALDAFARKWAESTVQRVKVAMAGLFYVALLSVAGMLILVTLSIADIQAVIEANANR